MFSRSGFIFLLRSAVTVGVLVLLGFASAAVSIRTCERRTRTFMDTSYRRALPNGPECQWLSARQIAVSPPPDDLRILDPFYPSFRAWLFQPRVIFYPHPRPPSRPGPHSCALVVTRTPLPFVVRVHGSWEYFQPFPDALNSKGGRVTVAYSVATYFGFFGFTVLLDQGQPPPTAPLPSGPAP